MAEYFLHPPKCVSNPPPRSEESSEDVRARMHAIQENEIDQLRELSKFLEMETRFAEQHLEVLRGVKDDWIDEFVLIPSPPRSFSNLSVA